MAYNTIEFYHLVCLCFLRLLSLSNKLKNCLYTAQNNDDWFPHNEKYRNMSFFTLIYNLCRKKVLLLYLGPWLPSRLGNLWLVTCTSIAQRANIFSVMIWPNTDNQFDSCSLMSFYLLCSYSRQLCLRPFWRM